jgi:ArsR family transcriptional regulator
MATNPDPRILDHMAVLAESARCRLMFVLDANELTVSDLCAILQLPQSSVSRHLKVLLDRGWVTARRDGTRRLYHGTVAELGERAKQLWDLTRTELAQTDSGRPDHERLQSVLAARASLASERNRSREFFDASSEEWDALRGELFGDSFVLHALMGLVPSDWVVADLGCGTGLASEALAPFVKHVVGVDSSAPMLRRAKQRLQRFDNVELQRGKLESLPIKDAEVDIATLMLVLHHVKEPQQAVREAARCLRPGGRILIVDMLPHNRIQYQQDMGHVWLGFSEEMMSEFLEDAGFEPGRYQVLPPAPDAKGPNLFAVSASLRSDK